MTQVITLYFQNILKNLIPYYSRTTHTNKTKQTKQKETKQTKETKEKTYKNLQKLTQNKNVQTYDAPRAQC